MIMRNLLLLLLRGRDTRSVVSVLQVRNIPNSTRSRTRVAPLV